MGLSEFIYNLLGEVELPGVRHAIFDKNIQSLVSLMQFYAARTEHLFYGIFLSTHSRGTPARLGAHLKCRL